MKLDLDPPKVLIITGSLLRLKENSSKSFLNRVYQQWKISKRDWLEFKIKLIYAELLISFNSYKVFRKKLTKTKLRSFFDNESYLDTRELTEVSLSTSLRTAGLSYEIADITELFDDPVTFRKKVSPDTILFLSTTFLRDLSELFSVLDNLADIPNRIILGGALTGVLKTSWPGHPKVYAVGLGYGEFLVPHFARWIKDNYPPLSTYKDLKTEVINGTYFVFAESPPSLNLDFIEKPDWRQSALDHKIQYKTISYESVRGCPYRCAFCNYPFLFDDNKFRTKSAKKMAQDWLEYSQETQAEYIICLDSLFTMPKPRLIEFCELLIKQKNRLKWICYARADDLVDENVVQLMVQSGAIQVQIGIESGDSQQLINMNKRTDPETNLRAIQNCKKFGLTSFISLIVGFPGETKQSVDLTLEFMKLAQPDFFFVATFSTRVPNVPILNEINRKKFNLVTMNNSYSISPYWKHETMDCFQAADYSRELISKIIMGKYSLEASLFYKNILGYNSNFKSELLEWQAQSQKWFRPLYFILNVIHKIVSRIRLKKLTWTPTIIDTPQKT